MADPFVWLEALAGARTLYELLLPIRPFPESRPDYRKDPELIAEAHRASLIYSTFSDEELEELTEKIDGCRRRFIEQGGGKDRSRCMCGIFQEVIEANGDLPDVADWPKMYEQLKCGKKVMTMKTGF